MALFLLASFAAGASFTGAGIWLRNRGELARGRLSGVGYISKELLLKTASQQEELAANDPGFSARMQIQDLQSLNRALLQALRDVRRPQPNGASLEPQAACGGCCDVEHREEVQLRQKIAELENQISVLKATSAKHSGAAGPEASISGSDATAAKEVYTAQARLEVAMTALGKCKIEKATCNLRLDDAARAGDQMHSDNAELQNKIQAKDTEISRLGEQVSDLASATSKKCPPTAVVRPQVSPEMPRQAFITLAHDDDPRSFVYLWQVVALARALQRVGSYPLVLLTDITTMPDGQTSVKEGLLPLNVHVLPLDQLSMPANFKNEQYPSWRVAYWKLQIWNLTQFDKLVWLDSDALVTRSLDWLFDESWMWAQRDDWLCEGDKMSVCSGMMLVFPNKDDFIGLQGHVSSKPSWKHGDQELIQSYFAHVVGRPVQLMPDNEAAFGQCIGKTRTPYVNADMTAVPGIWDTPAFVHKSGGFGGTNDDFSNVCFSNNVRYQYYQRGGVVINACHFHPLGPLWREMFCEGMDIVSAKTPESAAFCDDGCWYRGERSQPVDASWEVDDNMWCRPVQTVEGGQAHLQWGSPNDAGGVSVPGTPLY